ncbi:MAG TPA: hypothetical protein PLQ80_06845 [Candidatus Syntrophosphaera sp.]|jgi:hypothetical protein|nr:hypothetical protein [Candidatus Syntrophosphaera sp.]HPH60568.1 hypothetical protein [Candidatus Syntrophosphaera sp.]
MYQVLFKEGTYQIVKQGMPVYTPAGSIVSAENEMLARKLREHFLAFGTSHTDWRSLAHFHFPLLDFVRHYPKTDVILRLVMDLDPYNDWTLRPVADNPELERHREGLFGDPATQLAQGRAWLASLNEYQLCAALVLGRDLGSINAAWMATMHCDNDAEKQFRSGLVLFNPELGNRPLRELLANYRFYRGL